MRRLFKEKGLQQRQVFQRADIPHHYGYKLISQENSTRQRDIILRVCYAADLTLEETQKALRIYGMPQLYPRFPRDAILISAFSSAKTNLIDLDELLINSGHDPLRPCGAQE